MACTNCFNGCADITSDQCVKYTGVDIPGLDIHTGDTLLIVENKITDKIITLMDGSGIFPVLDPNDICEVVQELMPCCPPFNLNDILTVFVKSICILNDKNEGLKDRIVALEEAMNTLNADYVIKCLSEVMPDFDTHEIVQSIIDKVCELDIDLHTNYTPTSDLPAIISAYIADQPTTNKYNARMIPWVAYPIFFIPDGAFDSNGVGIVGTVWESIYLCQGTSKTSIPDLRGLVIVGSTDMPGNPTFPPQTNPNTAGNPTYEINGVIYGTNLVPLTIANMPNHNHSTVVTINDPGHTHFTTLRTYDNSVDNDGGTGGWNVNSTFDYVSSSSKTGLKGGDGATVTNPPQNVFVTIGNNGGGTAHPNVQPGVGAYYIMYIP